MTAFTYKQFCEIEGAVATVSNMIHMTGDNRLKENLRSAEYLMSVIRSHALTYHDAESGTDNAEIGLSLLSALYR